jgi:PTH2 family peptidyl-tRNA hydrolase
MAKKEQPKIKQVIVMRTDTDPPMRKGKMIAQGAHASIAFLLRRLEEASMRLPEPYMKYGDFYYWSFLDIKPEITDWMRGGQAKICVRADSLEQLLDIQKQAEKAGVECHVITDSGKTEFSEPTITCLALGPDFEDKIDSITGSLKLL